MMRTPEKSGGDYYHSGEYDSTPPLAHSSVSGSRDPSPLTTPIPPIHGKGGKLQTRLDPGIYQSQASLSVPGSKVSLAQNTLYTVFTFYIYMAYTIRGIVYIYKY